MSVGPFVSAPQGGPGVIWTRVVSHTTPVPAVRVHVQVRRGRAAADWRIRIRDLSGQEVESLAGGSPLLASGGVWSREVPGRGRKSSSSPIPTPGPRDRRRSVRLPRDLGGSAEHHRHRPAHSHPQGPPGRARVGARNRAPELHPGRRPVRVHGLPGDLGPAVHQRALPGHGAGGAQRPRRVRLRHPGRHSHDFPRLQARGGKHPSRLRDRAAQRGAERVSDA